MRQVSAAVELLDGGATVPFIARYRKEATGALDDAQLRTLEERLRYLRELDERRDAILESIRAQGKLTDELEAQILRRRLQGPAGGHLPALQAEAAHQGADRPRGRPGAAGRPAARATRPATRQRAAADFVDPDRGVADAAAALDGARAILVERFAEDADLVGELRESMVGPRLADLQGPRGPGRTKGAKFADYFEFAEPFAGCPRTAILALFRGEKEEILDLTLEPGGRRTPASYEQRIAGRFGIARRGPPGRPVAAEHGALGLAHPHPDAPERRHRVRLWQAAEDEAVRVFAANLRDLLLAAPAGARTTIGLDPGFRTGVKVAVVDGTGKVRRHRHHLPARAAPALGRGASTTLARLAAAAPRRAGRHRQRHRLAGDRPAGRRPDQAPPGAQADQGGGLRGRRVGLLRLGLRLGGTARPGRLAARRGLHRPAAAGPAGRAGQDRPEVHRRGAVPARRGRGQAVALAGRRGRGLRERGRGGREHRLAAAAGPGLRDHRPGWPTAIVAHRDANGPFRTRQQLMEVPRLGPEGVRAVRRVPAHPRRRRPARRLRRAPRGLPGGPPHPGRRPAARRPP